MDSGTFLSRSNNSMILLIVVIGLFTIMFFREYMRFFIQLKQLRQTKNIKSEDGSLKLKELPQEPVQIVDLNFSLLERYYEQNLTEFKLNSRATLIIASLGFMVIIIGIFLVFSKQVTIGILSSIGGIVSEVVANLFFNQNKNMVVQVNDSHKKLVSTQYLLTAISLTEKLPEEIRRNEIRRIITNLLFLSNELHGANSNHLFENNAINEASTQIKSI